MKVNIITQPLHCNYGGILQNYALQRVLRNMGHEPLTINRPTPRHADPPLIKAPLYFARNLIKKFKGEWIWPSLWEHRANEMEFTLSFPQRKFIEKYISKVDVPPPFTAAKLKDFPADAYIVGSDQVWRPWCSPYIGNCFLNFVESDEVKRIAYASSFGTDQWEISDAATERIRPLAKKFDAISVREYSGIDLCKENLDVEAVQMPDPTLLLEPADYLSLTDRDDASDKDYIGVYILDPNAEKRDYIRRISKEKKLEIRYAGRITSKGFDSVEHWIATIANAEYVVTDSFHGTVFSILFGKPVKNFSNSMRGTSRIDSLIRMLRLQSNDGEIIPDETTPRHLNDVRKKGIRFLMDHLSGTGINEKI